MAGFTGMASTFDLPNYAGELLLVSPTDTPFLAAIGGLSADSPDLVVTSTKFEWQTVDLAASAQPAILEGADPTYNERVRANVNNLVQIFQYGIKVTYSKLAAYNQMASYGNGQANPVQSELDLQVNLKLMTGAKDVNFSFINGAYNAPADNTTARKTRGLLAAIATHAYDKLEAGQAYTVAAATDALTANAHGYANGDAVRLSALTNGGPLAAATTYYVRDVTTNTFKLALSKGGAAINITADGSGTVQRMPLLSEEFVLDGLQNVYSARGINAAFEPTLIAGAAQKRRLSKIFITDKNYQETTRNVGGVSVQSIETDFGRINVMLDRDVPADHLSFAHLGMCMPQFLLVPNKGFFFVEPLAKTGSYEAYQLYGEIGLKYGDEAAHAKWSGLAH